MNDRHKILPRAKVDEFVKVLVDDVEWLWDFDAGKCAQYRWAFSGVGASSGHFERVSGGGVADPTGKQAENTPADRLRAAGWLLYDAHKAVADARTKLSIKDGRAPYDGSGNGYVSRKEMAVLRARQAARNARGDGYGDG